jgi:hypothetical protein
MEAEQAKRARAAAEEKAAKTLEQESNRLRQEAEAKLKSELDRVRREAEQARLKDKADAERIRKEAAAEARAVAEATLARETERARAEANARVAREVEQVRAEAERRRKTELDEMRSQVARVREAAAEQARSAAARVSSEDPRPTKFDAPAPVRRESAVFESSKPSPARRLPRFILPLAACLLVLAAGGFTLGSEKGQQAVRAVMAWVQGGAEAPEETPQPAAAPARAPQPPPPQPAASRPKPKTTGNLTITSTPSGAEVLFDGRSRGKTPLDLKDVPAGAHTVVLQANGGRVSQTVNVRVGTHVAVSMKIQQGYLSVASRVPLEIQMNGQRVGSSGDDRVPLPPGSHRLTFVNARMNYRSEQTVEIRPGDVTTLTISPPFGRVEVQTTLGAEVLIDGQKVGVAPLAELELPIGRREVVVRNPESGDKRTAVIEVKRDETTILSLPLGGPGDRPKPTVPRLAPLSAPPTGRPR